MTPSQDAVTQGTKETGSKVIGRLPIFAASLEFSPNLAEIRASFQRKEQEKLQLKTRTPTVDSASVEFLNPFNTGKKALKTVEIPMEDRLERGKSSGMSQKNMAHLLLQGLRSKDAEIRRSVFSMNEQELIQQTAFRCRHTGKLRFCLQCRNGCLLAQSPHPQSQLMALGSENLLANFSTCLAIIEYRVQHANSLSKFTEYQIGHARSNYKKMEQNIYKINKRPTTHPEDDFACRQTELVKQE
ncbi:conserved hypothetical protein [Culex quinquefasciatus]|uniref:Uncharacterized protein n=1 Tax=Culex quinquefasciatus TaxID=7176 RepID=B0X5A0_CULQU|nr:conserved hypothetical protein [Culex quinquefasciatus]|eukprot:XP_001864822.1 conserved hypothetical protein [Culex quinquefasciatus]